MLKHALAYLKLGWSVVPIKNKEKHPHVKWKEYQTKLPTIKEVKGWFTKWPNANVGIITGKKSGICSLDLDSLQAGESIEYQFGLPKTLIQETGRGRQYLFQYPKLKIKSQTGLIPDVDFRGENGIIVLPPSIHSSGKPYRWLDINPIEDGLNDLMPLPLDLELFIRNGAPAAQIKSPQKPQERLSPKTEVEGCMGFPAPDIDDPNWDQKILKEGVTEGNRNETLYKMACKWVGRGDSPGAILEMLHLVNEKNRPPLTKSEIKQIARSSENHRGKNEFSNFIQKKIFDFSKIVSPTGNHGYQMTVENQVGEKIAFKISPEQLMAPRLFALQLMQQCDVVLDLPKQKEWNENIRGLIGNQEIILKPEDETDMYYIRTLIYEEVKSQEQEKNRINNPGASISTIPVLTGGPDPDVYVKIAWIKNYLRNKGVPKTIVELAAEMKSMGFTDDRSTFRTRAWFLNYAKLKEGL